MWVWLCSYTSHMQKLCVPQHIPNKCTFPLTSLCYNKLTKQNVTVIAKLTYDLYSYSNII